jgi:glycosyltransferase involved in cell wall biosynthesis
MVTARPLVCFSLTREEFERLALDGPRRDIPLVAERAGGELLFRTSNSNRNGRRGKLAGPHLRHAWIAARKGRYHPVIFADGEHVGLPLGFFLAVLGASDTRLVMLGHYVDKPWKRALIWSVSRLVRSGTLILHSSVQAERVRGSLAKGWDLKLLPYQVDTDFWTGGAPVIDRPTLVAAGSENRDYTTLIEAVRDLDVDLQIASGSHWARQQATASDLPKNVKFLTQTLSFSELRSLYAKAAAIVVPLYPVNNQSGITTILEAMSMAKPLIVTATPGQREAVLGPVVHKSGHLEMDISRGPQTLGLQPESSPSGLYVQPDDAQALRRAITMVIEDRELAAGLSASARATVARLFSVEHFADRFSEVICRRSGEPDAIPVPVALA